MKKLFSDPHFNVMDGLDTYIDDYGKPDPIPLSMLRRMNQAAVLGLFDDETTMPRRRRRCPAAGAGFSRWCRPCHGGTVESPASAACRPRTPRR